MHADRQAGTWTDRQTRTWMARWIGAQTAANDTNPQTPNVNGERRVTVQQVEGRQARARWCKGVREACDGAIGCQVGE